MGTVPGPRDNPHIADWQWDHHCPITLSPRQVSGSCRPGGWVSLPIRRPGLSHGGPGQAPPGAVQRNHPAWRKEDLQLLGGLPRAWRPLGWLPGPSSDVTFSGSPSPDPPGFPPSHCGIYLLAWRPSLLWGLRTQSSTHCCVPSTWHTVGALQTLPMNGRTDGEGLMGNPGGRFQQQYPCAIMLTPSCLSDGVGHTDTPLKGG